MSFEYMEQRELLYILRKNIKFWCLAGRFIGNIQDACVDILKHGLLDFKNDRMHQQHYAEAQDLSLEKFIEELEWVYKSTQLRDLNFFDRSKLQKKQSVTTVHNFLSDWVLLNLKQKTMCASIQSIVSEKDFLQNFYTTNAFLRNESYSNAFAICLSAFELNQCSLLSQIDENLYKNTNSIIVSDCVDSVQCLKYKRTNSHPNVSLITSKNIVSEDKLITDTKSECPTANTNSNVIFTFRKVKSMPTISTFLNHEDDNNEKSNKRPRSKTMSIVRKRPPPKPILSNNFENQPINFCHKKFPHPEISSFQSRTSGSLLSSSGSTNTASPANSLSSSSTESKARRIHLIKCDDIKIWTDQSHTDSNSPNLKIDTCKSPSPVPIKKPKSISPMNSILSSLFGTPPPYSTWYTGDVNDQSVTEPSIPSDANESTLCNATFNGSRVFDVFKPVNGQKMQVKQNSNLFEDGISTLDYKSNASTSEKKATTIRHNDSAASTSSLKKTEQSCQSLTAFLQSAQLTRNNTDLEKENAHFRISEAIITAIEHIKWAKAQPDGNRRQCGGDVIVATDWLENERKDSECYGVEIPREETIFDAESETVPYVEHCENHETLSAETVGLSIISRFNDNQLPKVSELKWLVSDDDTPQQLLPMPEKTSNPDDNILPPMTRGTKYWAPPRAQIIFTDHPIPNRKEQIRKQNNRCSGCGMRVSEQNISSFRFCTYFGKYNCTGCHRLQVSTIPAKILQFWDFKSYPVSVFAYRLLGQISTFPLFHVPDLNAPLYIKSKALLEARNKRRQLKFIKDFVRTCRFATREQSYFETIPDYITNDPDNWSISDFVDAKNGSMQRSINELIEKCENHILHCVLCMGRGFCCEFCQSSRVIFPWSSKVFRCDRCGSCFHLNCWKAMHEICFRCQRIRNRSVESAESLSDK